MVDPHITTLKQWDPTENFLHPFVFILIIGTNVRVISPWPKPASKIINNSYQNYQSQNAFPGTVSQWSLQSNSQTLGGSYVRYFGYFAELRYPVSPPI
jgi:hypothetical protein